MGKTVGFCAVVLAGVTLVATQAPARTLDQELNHVIATHPQINQRKENISAAGEQIRVANSVFYPSVALRGESGHERVDSPARRASPGELSKGRADSTALTVTLNLFDGFSKYAGLGEARYTKSGREFELDATRQKLLFDGSNAYLEVLRQLRLIVLADLSIKNIRRQLRLEDERVRRGSGLTVDVLQAKSRLQIAKELRVRFIGRLNQAASRYLQIFGRAAVRDKMVLPKAPIDALPATMAEAVAIAREENPTLANADRQIDIATERRRRARSEFYPRIDIVGEGKYDHDLSGVRGTHKAVSIKLKATWELFSGFAHHARVNRASHDRAATMSNHTFVDRQTADEVRIAWHALETAMRRRDLLENAVNIAGEVFEARKKLRSAGKETVINVLDAENEVNDARIKLTGATFDHLVAVYRVLFAIGRLTPKTLGLN